MRTTADRIRNTVLFEILGLALSAPVAAWILHKEIMQVGILGFMLSLIAMLVNYFFNLLFDRALKFFGRSVRIRPVWLRIFHAVLFETFLIILTLPLVAWWLNLTLWNAFLTDLGFTLFFLAYAFAFNWGYDIVFPMPAAKNKTKGKN